MKLNPFRRHALTSAPAPESTKQPFEAGARGPRPSLRRACTR